MGNRTATDDCLVVGAGPAGCFAAAEAASRGAATTVVEEHSRIGQPVHCTGLVSQTALNILSKGPGGKRGRLNYKPAQLNYVDKAVVFSKGARLEVPLKRSRAIVLDRGKFDSLCGGMATDCGASVITGKRMGRCELIERKCVIIGADGPVSTCASTFNFPPIRRFAVCHQAEFEGATLDDEHTTMVFISSKFAPGFFGWAVPAGAGRVRVGLGVLAPNNAKRSFERFVSCHPEVSGMLRGARRDNSSEFSALVPISVRERTSIGNVMLVGDAAGQVKSLTGGGIYFGCSCARLAGALAGSGGDGNAYEREWRARYLGDLAVHRRARQALAAIGDTGSGLLISGANAVGLDSFMSRHLDIDSPSETLRSMGFGAASGAICKYFNIVSQIVSE